MKRCSTALIIGERQIKTTVRSHLILIKMAITKTTTNNQCWRGCGEKGRLLVGGNVSWCSHYEKQYAGFSEN